VFKDREDERAHVRENIVVDSGRSAAKDGVGEQGRCLVGRVAQQGEDKPLLPPTSLAVDRYAGVRRACVTGSPPTDLTGARITPPAQSVSVGAIVQLSGAGSSDPDGDPLEYHWTFLSKAPSSAAQLSGATLPAAAISPSFIADKAGLYTVRLIVNDGQLDSQPDVVSITATGP